MGKIDKELEIKIIKRYADGVPMRFIAQELGLNTTSVFNVLRRNNVKTRTKGGIEQLDADEIIALYKSGIPSTKIASQKKVTVHTITNILEKHDVTRDNVYHNTSLKEDYWFDINTKDKAYFLGFLITDGNVIGINTLKLSGTGVEGIGFSIPINSQPSGISISLISYVGAASNSPHVYTDE
mgnify:CR=1 FL=1